MSLYYEKEGIRIYREDNLELLRSLPDDSVGDGSGRGQVEIVAAPCCRFLSQPEEVITPFHASEQGAECRLAHGGCIRVPLQNECSHRVS